MYDIVIIHGILGHPFENWIPWIFKETNRQNKNNIKFRKLILISGLYEKIGIPEFDNLNESFFEGPKLLVINS